MKKELLEKANKLPMLPGVYRMLDKGGNVIYVGKAKKLKNRVTSYFRGEHLPKVEAMVEKVDDFSVIIVNSELEALVLENSLIKQYKPYYNILLKDDKGYPFIRIDKKNPYTDITMVSRANKDGASYYGPYGARSKTRDIISMLKHAYLLPDCGKSFPGDLNKSRPCINMQIGKCAGWCTGKPGAEDYQNRIEQICKVLEGKTADTVSQLHKRMLEESAALNFEKAAELRDRITIINSLGDKQRVFSTNFDGVDAIGFCRGPVCCLSVLKYNNGNLTDKDTELVDEPIEDNREALSSIIKQYYSCPGVIVPNTVLVPCEIDFMQELEESLSQFAGRSVCVEYPKRGQRRELLERAEKNASEELLRITSEEQRRVKSLDYLAKALGLKAIPERIEAFDISNLGNSGIVAGMTVFVGGKPFKGGYRRFNLKEITRQDDYESMYTAVFRRFSSYLRGESGFSELPQLLLIDGGDRHAAKAVEALNELKLNIPVFGMVKDNRHRTRALISSDGEEIGIAGNQMLFSLIGTIQEETHHFAIDYQKKLRTKGIATSLDKIPGIGSSRKQLLLGHFKTISAIAAAEYEELCRVIPRNAAETVYNHYHNMEKNK